MGSVDSRPRAVEVDVSAQERERTELDVAELELELERQRIELEVAGAWRELLDEEEKGVDLFAHTLTTQDPNVMRYESCDGLSPDGTTTVTQDSLCSSKRRGSEPDANYKRQRSPGSSCGDSETDSPRWRQASGQYRDDGGVFRTEAQTLDDAQRAEVAACALTAAVAEGLELELAPTVWKGRPTTCKYKGVKNLSGVKGAARKPWQARLGPSTALGTFHTAEQAALAVARAKQAARSEMDELRV